MKIIVEALRAELKSAGVSVITAYPGVVDTRIRYRGLNAAGVAAGASGLKLIAPAGVDAMPLRY